MTVDDDLPMIEPDDGADGFLCKDPVQLKSFQAEIDHTNGTAEAAELLCVLAVIRHGDRTPKQKLKLTVRCAFAAHVPIARAHAMLAI